MVPRLGTPIRLIAAALLWAGATGCNAMPAMGATSRATAQISLSVSNRLQLVAQTDSPSLDQPQSFCLWGNSPVGTYDVTLLGDSPTPLAWANGGSEHMLETGTTVRAIKVTAGAGECTSGKTVNATVTQTSAPGSESPTTLILGLE
jgi:hypothetical protein